MNLPPKPPIRRTLGRGLDALLGGGPAPEIVHPAGDLAPAPTSGRGSAVVPISAIRPGKYQPRRHFSDEELDALAQSIREKGILQPLLVRPVLDSEGTPYELIAGERRWRAAQRAQMHEVPVLIRELSDAETLEVALVENLQRQDLSAIEEAAGYQRLMDEFSHTQERLSQIIGRSRPHIANILRLLALPAPIQAMLQKGDLSAGHARALIGLEEPVALALAQAAAKEQLTVRDVERRAQILRDGKKDQGRSPAPAAAVDPDIAQLERDLAQRLGLKVTLESKGERGRLILAYASLEQLDDLLRKLRGAE
jgi:ParB family chromosome partitioning protein